MPFLQILWAPDRVGEERIVRVRDHLIDVVGPALMSVDPDHVVNAAMVDAHLVEMGPLDRFRSDIFVTLLARTEPARVLGAASIVDVLTRSARDAASPTSVVVELVLTDHHSSFDYASLE
jgi:hypothetical protein